MDTIARWLITLTAAAALTACAMAESSQPSCGDGTCSSDESCSSCASDCGSCVDSGAPMGDDPCGDGTCDMAAGECDLCPGDCSGMCNDDPPGPMCGDNTCDANETCTSCAADCGSCPPPATCGDTICDVVGGECSTCSADCFGICGVCGDGTCDSNEDEITCAADCDVVSSGMCTHSWCDIGGPLAADCDPCVTAVCNLDFYCCLVEWDVSCKNAVSSMCLQSC